MARTTSAAPGLARWRWLALGAVGVVAAGGITIAVVQGRALAERQATSNLPAPVGETVPVGDLVGRRHLLFRSTELDREYGFVKLVAADDPDGPTAVTSLECNRVDFNADRGICLSRGLQQGFGTTTRAAVFDAELRPLHTIELAGYPSRTTVSPNGRWGATTTFVSGHSYATMGAFSVRTDIIDLRSGELVFDLEKLTVRRDGETIQNVDFNFWGVTFASDNRTFFATLGTGGRTFLLKADRVTREATVVHPDVECPSLSPDNRRIVFKKRLSGPDEGTWRLSVLDLASMTEHPLAETRNVDDQAAWLDDDTVMYGLVADPDALAAMERALPGLSPTSAGGSLVTDTWVVRADGGGSPELLRGGSWSTSADGGP